MEFFANASPGTEKALQEELIELGFKSVRLNKGGIPFLGDISEGWRACLYSRIAQRIQLLLKRFPAENEKQLYENAKDFNWQEYLTPQHTFSVSAFVHSSALTHSGYVALKVKDAIADAMREHVGERPSVNRDDPDIRVFVFLGRNKCALYLDMSGIALFQRGYRIEKGEAPLKETIAAAILRYSGWDKNTPLWDPMCGSGTIAIEAALMAKNVAPGIFRDKFGFERWANFDSKCAEKMREMRGQARRNATGNCPQIIASDNDENVLAIAKANARRAGVRISFKNCDISEMRGDNVRRFIITNPPFNERLAANESFYRKMGAAFSRMHGCRVAFICSNDSARKSLPLKENAFYLLKNGDLDCRLSVYEIPILK